MPRFSFAWTKALTAPRPKPIYVVRLSSGSPLIPALCANCGAIPSAAEREKSKHCEVWVPYCESCYERLQRQVTKQVAASLASVVVAVTLLLTLPRVAPNLGAWPYVCATIFASCVPAALVWLLRRPVPAPLSAEGRAAWWAASNELYCLSEGFARLLCKINDSDSAQVTAREPLLRPHMLLGSLIGLLIGPTAHAFLHPELRVLNLAADEFRLFADEKSVGTVKASSLESPGAGRVIRLGVGKRTLRAVDHAGQTLAQIDVTLSAGQRYLYAPLSADYCFWTERDDYGQAGQPKSGSNRIRLLPADREFWLLPERIDNWFSANPEPAGDRRSSGGSLTTLRQSRCSDAPEAGVR